MSAACSVVGRELRTYRLDRALLVTLASAREYKQQLQHWSRVPPTRLPGQEGIIVDANPAWISCSAIRGRMKSSARL
jgi:hypothetical protein